MYSRFMYDFLKKMYRSSQYLEVKQELVATNIKLEAVRRVYVCTKSRKPAGRDYTSSVSPF